MRLKLEALPDRVNPSGTVAIYDNADTTGTGPKHATTEHFQEAADDYENYGAHTWDDIIVKLRDRVAQNGKIDVLYIFDHGYTDTHKQEFGDQAIAPHQFEQLKPFMAPNAVLVLAGCTVAQDDAYCNVAAFASGTTVVASDASVDYITGGTMWGDDFYSTGQWHGWNGNGEVSTLPIQLKAQVAATVE